MVVKRHNVMLVQRKATWMLRWISMPTTTPMCMRYWTSWPVILSRPMAFLGNLKCVHLPTVSLLLPAVMILKEENTISIFQSLSGKPFTLVWRCGNYIQWTGDPLRCRCAYQCRIIWQRTYRSEATWDWINSIQSGAASSGVNNNVRKYREVVVIAKLTDKLLVSLPSTLK